MGNIDFNKLFENKGFKIVLFTVIVVLLIILILFTAVTIPKINSGDHIKVFGLEYNIPKDHPDTVIKTVTLDTKDIQINKTGIKPKISILGSHKTSARKNVVIRDTIKPSIKYQITAPINQSAVGDGATVTNNNYEPKSRILSKEEAQAAFNAVIKLVANNKGWNTSTKVRYTVAVQDAEALKFADQIATFLYNNGFTNWDVRYAIYSGIRSSNFEVVKGSENNSDFIEIHIFSQKSVNY